MTIRRLSAFTLIELLVSLALSGLLLVIINQQLQNSFFLNKQIEDQLEFKLQVETIFEHLSADIKSATLTANGHKSVKFSQLQDDFVFEIKRFGLAPKTKQITGMTVKWRMGANGIHKSISSSEGVSERQYSKNKLSINIKNFAPHILKLEIKTDKFQKSKLFIL